MLQARVIACILLLVTSALLAGNACAQDTEEPAQQSDFKRLGDDPVENEPVLDLSLPEPEQKIETAQEREAKVRAARENLSLIHI